MKLPVPIAVLCLLPCSAALAQKAIAPTPLPAPTEAVTPATSSRAAHDWAAPSAARWKMAPGIHLLSNHKNKQSRVAAAQSQSKIPPVTWMTTNN